MIVYASVTRTRAHLERLRAHQVRLFLSPDTRRRTLPAGFKYAIDNGAWGFHNRNEPPEWSRFADLLDEFGAGADFIVAPDIVAGGVGSLRLSENWIGFEPTVPWYVAVQDGMKPRDLRHLVDHIAGLFIGGTTAWKLDSAPMWSRLAREHRIGCHMGRVNTARRANYAKALGCTSIDGSGLSRFTETLNRVVAAERQGALEYQ